MIPTVDLDRTTFEERRRRLRDAIANMADAIVAGEITPTRGELQALVLICNDHRLPVEAARVMRWMAP